MKKNLIFILVFSLICSSLSGCLKRVDITSIEKERVDQDVSSGNKGFIAGTPPPEDQVKERSQTRHVYQVVLELPPYPEWKNFNFKPTIDKKLWGNRGYIYGGPQIISEPEPEPQQEEEVVLPDEEIVEESETEIMKEPEIKQPAFTIYVVKEGDTLQKISSKVYGTTKKWQKIYDFNKDSLTDPNKIYPGQKIKIPRL